jgi:hypothetical protein
MVRGRTHADIDSRAPRLVFSVGEIMIGELMDARFATEAAAGRLRNRSGSEGGFSEDCDWFVHRRIPAGGLRYDWPDP